MTIPHPIDDQKTSSSLCMEHIFVFLAEFLEYKVDNFCDQIARIYNQHFPGQQHEMVGCLHPANQVQRNRGNGYSLSILIQHNHQGRATLISYQIISTQNSDILLQGQLGDQRKSQSNKHLRCLHTFQQALDKHEP